MENPFESGHIKNYILFYVSVVVIVILFFIATTLFHDVKKVDKKIFNTEITKELKTKSVKKEEVTTRKFKLLDEKFIK
ncbi:MAG: hypothetical protein L3J10_10120 [Sulfurimonas sp.]|nr:hypothetical protein [Sulfurimonas sp.]